MKSSLWTVVLLLATVGGLLTVTNSARANAKEDEEVAIKKQEVWDTQIRFASIALTSLMIMGGAYWVLGKANQNKKAYSEELRKQEHLDPNEGMPIN